MRKITPRRAVQVLLLSMGWLWVACSVLGCAAPEENTPGDSANASNSPDPALLRIDGLDHVEGDPQAPNVIIEYGDFASAACGDFFRDNKPVVIIELVDAGQAVFVFRHFPQASLHPQARLAAIASECAVDFFEYHDLLFNHQDALTHDELIGYAQQVGLNPTTFENCLENGAKAPRVDRDVDSGTQLGVQETPTFFVNGEMLTGNPTLEDFQARLSRE